MEAVRCMKKSGIACEVGYILWHDHSTTDSVRREAEQLHDYGLLSPRTALSRLILYPGSRLHKMAGIRKTAQAPLPEKVRVLFDRWESLLQPLFPLWTQASVLLPGMACRAWLRKDPSLYLELTDCIEMIKEQTYNSLAEDSQPDSRLCREIGEKISRIRNEV